MRFRCARLTFLISLTLVLAACSTASLNKAEFGVQVPPTPSGAQKFLGTGTTPSLSAGIARKNWSVKLKPIKNDGGEGVDPDTLDAVYNIDAWGYGELDVFSADETRSCTRLAFGLMPYPYMAFSIGKNYRHFEFFIHGLFSYTWERSTYSGEGAMYHGGFISYYETGPLKNNLDDQSHGNLGGGFSLGAFFPPFGAFYNAFAYDPWAIFDSVGGSVPDGSDSFDIDVDFPLLLIQDFGVSYNFYDKFLFRLGMSVIVGDFEGRYFSPHADVTWFL